MRIMWGVAGELAYEGAHVFKGAGIWGYMKRLEGNWGVVQPDAVPLI